MRGARLRSRALKGFCFAPVKLGGLGATKLHGLQGAGSSMGKAACQGRGWSKGVLVFFSFCGGIGEKKKKGEVAGGG